MYRNKKDVDKHVENLISKLSVKEFKTRAFSVARLYYEVGDYASCQRYVEQYLTQKDNNAAAYKLLGQALHKLGQKEKALEHFKTSLDIDPSQTSTLLDICELLVDDEIIIDPGRAKYWCEKVEATFPRNPVTFRLKEKLVSIMNPNPEALVDLLTSELSIRPKDPLLHARLLKHYMHTNQIKEAINHTSNIEFGDKTFRNNYAWYETLAELLKHNLHNFNDWLFQLLLLTVRERMCVLSLTDTPSSSKSLIEANELLFLYDQDIENVSQAGATPGHGEFHASLLQHHRGQFALHAATLLLKRAKKDQLTWRIAAQYSAPLMLIAWHTSPTNTKVNWLPNAPEKQQLAARRWYSEGVYRCSQAGHYLISNSQDKNQSYIDQISQCCSGTHWRDKMFEKLFSSRAHLAKIKSSHFVTSSAYSTPILRLPRKTEVETLDGEALMDYPNSLHHFVWVLLNYKNFAHFKVSLFDTLTPTSTNYGPESMNKTDIQAFLYCSALTAKQQKSNDVSYISTDKPVILPANITDLLCTLSQLKWWDCAYKFSQNELGTELTDIRGTLSRGIEVVRCIDSHGLDPELLCHLGRIFSEKAKSTTAVEEKNSLEQRAVLYYASAIPLLEKLRSKIVIKLPEKRMFEYTHKELSTKELNLLIEESKLYVAVNFIRDCEYDKAIGLLSSLRSPEAVYHLSQTYRKIALEEQNQKDKYVALLLKARITAYKAIDSWKQSDVHKNNPLFSDTQELIEELDTLINRIDPDLSGSVVNDVDGGKYSSDENVSIIGSENIQMRSNLPVFRNLSSTPKASTSATNNITNYRTAVDSHTLDSTRLDQRYLERIETEIKNLQKRDTTINDFMEQTKKWFEENKKLGNEIITTINSNIQNTTDQFKLLKISVDQVKDQIDECRNECKDVGDLKKQIAEMKKEINKLKKASSEQNIDESDLYNLEDEYRTNESTSNFTSQLPFVPPVIPSFNQRLVPPFPVPPNPYQLYGQNLYNLYSQYSQFGQSPQVPNPPTIFDPTRGQMNYPGVYPTPEAMYLDVAQLVQPPIPANPAVSIPTVPVAASLPSVSSIPTVPSVSVPSSLTTVGVSKPIAKVEPKDIPRSLPVNVVITSSDPLPTCTTTPAPILSVTIPSKHIKGSPHNYQIPMPAKTDTKVISPPVFSFPSSDNKLSFGNIGNTSSNWNQSSVFKVTVTSSVAPIVDNTSGSLFSTSKSGDLFDNSKSVVDGIFNTSGSFNKSRTLSEKSNTSVEYDPCPDFQPIVPLPAEIKVTTGEEDETVIFSSRAKLFRFVDKQWKERGLGEMKLLKHNVTGKVRVLMRREQIHKICANHIITSDMEIKPMKNETKAYFWVANDFADETVVLEKFCIRFKTADIASQFYEKFEEARKASLTTTESISKNEQDKKSNLSAKTASMEKTPVKIDTASFGTPQSNTSSGFNVGGFTFSSTPTFKPVVEDVKVESKSVEPATTKANIFSTLSFKTNTTSPFSNIFTMPASQPTTSSTDAKDSSAKLNTSDTVEEFEPNVEFEPVIPLPALVEQKTGEEDEIILFEHRAKLLRFDSATREWKERGLGNIKLLAHKDNVQKVRLLMRREQIMKVCCNHALSKDISFQKMPNMDKAVTWCAKDFSDGELVSETFCLRFKTVQTCDEFIQAVKSAQSKLKDDTKTAKEEQNAAKQNTKKEEVGFGDQFKPKPGAWTCDMCYTNNLESFDKCACCEQPKPQAVAKTHTSTTIATTAATNARTTTTSSNWGDAFKPKPGSWECKECLIRNEATKDSCSACNSPRDPTAAKCTINPTLDDRFKCCILPKFDIPANNTPKDTTTGWAGWGDKFKSKEGTWECKQCFVRNEAESKNCNACSNPKDPSDALYNSNSIFDSISSGPKFNFGIPANSAATTSATTQSANQTSSIFDGTGAHKFSFGVPSNNSPNVVTFGEQKASSVIFATPKAPENQGPLNFSLKLNEKGDVNVMPKAAPAKDESNVTPFGGKFDFVFKPKTPPKSKSPMKSPKSQKGDESDDNEYASEDEGHHIVFSPVIPLPDKVDVVTGEENEIELYGHRAKLFRFVSGEWKERGIGVVKILKHKYTGKLRVVMRREQVLKICLNHALTPDIMYTPKDDKTWLFAANDFSEGELSLHKFCLRFKSKEIASKFKEAVENSCGTKSGESVPKQDTIKKQESDKDDVVFVTEIQATAEEKQKAKELMLPENFFTYKTKEPCQGCRGCDKDEEAKSTTLSKFAAAMTSAISTPAKASTPIFSSPSNSMYGTPSSSDKTIDVSMFRTPLGALGANTKTASSLTANSNFTKTNVTTDKENAFMQKPSIFSGLTEQKTLFGTPQNNVTNISNTSETLTSTPTKNSSILAPPKLSTNILKPGEEKQNVDPKSLFGAAQNNPAFGKSNSMFGNFNSGTSMNKSIFGFTADKTTEEPEKVEVKSIFGGDEQKPINLFSVSGQGSLFGPGALGGNQTNPVGSIFGSSAISTFGSNNNSSQVSGNGGSIFGNNQAPTWTINANTEQKKPDVTPQETVVAKKADEPMVNTEEKKDSLFKVDGNLSFAALSSSGPGFSLQKKPDFKWEGAGQQLFSAAQKEAAEAAKNDSGAGDDAAAAADEEYDPHYEPIVPLPDKIVVTTGEEDEEKMYGERCKLYRYDEKTREWKERGVGEIKVLYHPARKTYRLLLRREQVHKAVLNMLVFMDLELLPMKNSDRAWTWAGINYAETAAGEQETLAVRFKSVDLAQGFRDKVVECVRKLQAAAAQAIREEKDTEKPFTEVTPLRLPKHLLDSARADKAISAKVEEHTQSPSSIQPFRFVMPETKPNGQANKPAEVTEVFKQVHFQEPAEEEDHDEEEQDEDGYEHDYNEDYEGYYEEEEESAPYYSCEGSVHVQQGADSSSCDNAQVQVLFDPEICSPKILVTDADTGEILADMLIHTDTEFQMSGDSCTWSGTDYTSNEPVDKTVTLNCPDSYTAMQFYDSCETSKAATYSSTDPES